MLNALKLLRLFLILILCLVSLACSAQTDVSKAPRVSAQTIQKQAEQAFKAHTENRVGKYSLSTPKDEGQHWSVLVKGTDEFARPGYHWIVKIDKSSGRTQVIPGE
jgi:hypothetical protein